MAGYLTANCPQGASVADTHTTRTLPTTCTRTRYSRRRTHTARSEETSRRREGPCRRTTSRSSPRSWEGRRNLHTERRTERERLLRYVLAVPTHSCFRFCRVNLEKTVALSHLRRTCVRSDENKAAAHNSSQSPTDIPLSTSNKQYANRLPSRAFSRLTMPSFCEEASRLPTTPSTTRCC